MKRVLLLIILALSLVGCKNELPKLDTPQNLSINDNKIVFDEVPNANRYELSINDSTVSISTTEYQLTLPGIYIIKVKAKAYGYQDSDFTPTITHTIPGANPNLRFKYSLQSDLNLVIFDSPLDNSEFSLTNVEKEYLKYENNTIELESSYLKTLSVGSYDYTLTVNNIPHSIQIEIIDSANPYAMINNNYYFNPALDIIIRFDSQDCVVQKINGNNLDTNAYSLTDNELFVSKSFFTNYFNKNTEYKIYTLTIVFERENETYLVPIWIHRDYVQPS